MSRRTCLVLALVCLFVSPGILLEHRSINVHNHVSLVADVHNYYKASCVMLIKSDNYNDPSTADLMQSWSLQFSRRGIFSVASTFAKLVNKIENYYNRISRPLFVVLLDTKESMDQFALATRKIRISFPIWLVLFMQQSGNPLKEFCQRPKGNPFNLIFSTEMLVLCYDDPILKEWYAQSDNSTRVSNLATWSLESGFAPFSMKSLYARRGDMLGETMRAVTVNSSPFVSLHNGILNGFIGEVVLELSAIMNFTIDLRRSVQHFGGWNEEKAGWTGAIGEIIAGQADLGIGEFTLTSHRLAVVDFTMSLVLSRTKMYLKEPCSSAVEWSQYFKAFDRGTWALVVGLIATAPILITVIKMKGDFSVKVMVESYMQVWGIYCQQGLPEFPRRSSVRLAFFSIFISALIVCSAYSASLISYLTTATGTLPFNTLEGFVDDGTYKLIVVTNTADFDLFQSTRNNFFLRMGRLMKMRSELPPTIRAGFRQTCGERVGFYVAEAFKNAFSIYLPCKLTPIDTGNVESLALILSKNSQYTGLINYHLQRFQDYGILSRLRALESFRAIPQESKHDAVTIWGIAPILSVLAGGMILGCLLLLIEKVVFSKLDETEPAIFRQRTRGKFVTSEPSNASVTASGKDLRNYDKLIIKSDCEILRSGYLP